MILIRLQKCLITDVYEKNLRVITVTAIKVNNNPREKQIFLLHCEK